jgi:alanine racemase
MNFSELAKISESQTVQLAKDRKITYLLTDSRKALASEEALFFAIAGERNDGHQFIAALYQSGIRQFVIERAQDVSCFPEASFLLTTSSIHALQSISSFHRKQFSIPVIGITGSNGKTVIKEWLHQLLSPDFNIVKNPGSYNSQLGVPLSLWQMQEYHQLGIFEAGISQTGEMERLERIIQPSIGLFTNIGSAHDEGFQNQKEKIAEKIKLFKSANVIIYCSDQHQSAQLIEQIYQDKNLVSWGKTKSAAIRIHSDNEISTIDWRGKTFSFRLPFKDQASIENIHHCIAVMLHLNIEEQPIQERILQLKGVSMRMELKQGINHCQIIDDTYNNDLGGLQISLDFLSGQQKKNKTLILSDLLQSGLPTGKLIDRIENLIISSGVDSLHLIGPEFSSHKKSWTKFKNSISFYASTEDFISTLNRDNFHDAVVLVKGARVFRFERIVQLLQRKIHGTVMEIDLGAMVHNLNYFKSKLKPGVKLMVMVKAFAYGSGSEEVANLLQYHRVDYLGVAYTDEGIELRKNQIALPIMVMNPSEENFTALLEYKLEPEIYNLRILYSFARFLNGRSAKIHFKMETGMHRLGFDETDLKEAIELLRQNTNIIVASVFSHIAGADESQHDDFTREQGTLFRKLATRLMTELKISPILHILNTPGILRFPDLQFDMVRLGIGLYGVNPTEKKEDSLRPVVTLKSIISQIKTVKAGESIGYGRKGRAKEEMKIATIAIGYADGFNRAFSQGKGAVLINGKRAPVVGNVCMDMTMIDITGINAAEGDEVIIFGEGLSIYDVASAINTIPYEILTNTSERVKRVFWAEGI